MDIRAKFTREFALEVCTRFARGEGIDEIAADSGNTQEEIKALLTAYHTEMQQAMDRAASTSPAQPKPIGARVDPLERIAEALEKLVELFAKEEC